MSGTIDSVADPIIRREAPRWVAPLAEQPFDDALTGLRVAGSILLHGHHRPPWAAQVPGADDLRAAMNLPADARVVPFHLVLSGSFRLQFDREPPLEIGQGKIVMCVDGAAHRMSQGTGAPVLAFKDILDPGCWRAAGATGETGNEATELVCGAFALRGGTLNPLLAALPRVLVVDTRSPDANPMLAHIAAMIELEVARHDRDSFATSRLIEILFAEALKEHGRSNPGPAGWFRALGDRKLARALSYIHRCPEQALSVELLAREAAMSPSRFAARFREGMGQPVMAYVTRWRMNIACRKLAESRAGLTEIAAQVGYQDTASFSRAFKALLGQSPAHWRNAHK